MKRNSVVKIIGTVILAILLITSQDCWPQIAPYSTSKPFAPPFRTYSLQLSPDKVWIIVVNTISELEFGIRSEDASSLLLIAIGKPYYVTRGLGMKKECKQVTIELQQKVQGIYDCYIKIEGLEFWPVNNCWTKMTNDVDVTDVLSSLVNALNKKLKPYSK